MHKDKRALVETLRHYKRHILGPIFTEAADTIEELLDKQTAKKPLNRTGWPKGGRDTAEGFCPCCGMLIFSTTPRYHSKHDYFCRDCGQKIDWSPEQEEQTEEVPCGDACDIKIDNHD